MYGGKIFRLPQAGDGAAAQQPAVKAGALLVGEHHHFQGVPGGLSGVGQSLHHLNGRDDAQRAVVLTTSRHGVCVRAHGYRRQGWTAALDSPDNVAGGVDTHRHAGPAHQLHHVVAPGHIEGGKCHALHTVVSVPDLPQRGEVVIQAGGVDGY